VGAIARSSECAPPPEDNDGQAIAALVSEFNRAVSVNDFDRLRALFTRDGEYGVGKSPSMPVSTAIRQLPPKRLPWDERTPLRISVPNVWFMGPEMAVANAIESDYAPMSGITRRWGCTFVLLRVGGDWRIASYREAVIRGADFSGWVPVF
jgi:hypothetical protein